MQRWTEFLNSLATRGGNIFVLLVASMCLLLVVLNLMLAGVEGRAVTVIETAFASAFGALVAMLSGGMSRQRTGDQNGNGAKRDGA